MAEKERRCARGDSSHNELVGTASTPPSVHNAVRSRICRSTQGKVKILLYTTRGFASPSGLDPCQCSTLFDSRSWTAWDTVETTAPARTPLATVSSILSTSPIAQFDRDQNGVSQTGQTAPGQPGNPPPYLYSVLRSLAKCRSCPTNRVVVTDPSHDAV